jgi:hypothetical protein
VTIFQTSVADIAERYAGMARELLCNPCGVGADFFKPKKIVLTGPGGRKGQGLGYLEILRRLSDSALYARLAVGPQPIRYRIVRVCRCSTSGLPR